MGLLYDYQDKHAIRYDVDLYSTIDIIKDHKNK